MTLSRHTALSRNQDLPFDHRVLEPVTSSSILYGQTLLGTASSQGTLGKTRCVRFILDNGNDFLRSSFLFLNFGMLFTYLFTLVILLMIFSSISGARKL